MLVGKLRKTSCKSKEKKKSVFPALPTQISQNFDLVVSSEIHFKYQKLQFFEGQLFGNQNFHILEKNSSNYSW